MSENIKENILNKIKNGEVKMKSKTYFALGSAFTGTGLVGVFTLLSIIINFLFFRYRKIRMNPIHFPQRHLMFLTNFPWELVFFSLGLVILGLYFFKKTNKWYKYNLKTLAILVVFSLLISGFVIDKTGINEKLKQKGKFKGIYSNVEGLKEQRIKVEGVRNERKVPKHMYYTQ